MVRIAVLGRTAYIPEPELLQSLGLGRMQDRTVDLQPWAFFPRPVGRDQGIFGMLPARVEHLERMRHRVDEFIVRKELFGSSDVNHLPVPVWQGGVQVLDRPTRRSERPVSANGSDATDASKYCAQPQVIDHDLSVRMAGPFSLFLAGHKRSGPAGNVFHSCTGKAFRQNLRLPADSRDFTDAV